MRYLILATFAVWIVSPKTTIGAETKPPQQYVVTVVLREVPLSGSKQKGKILADPQVAMLANEEANFWAGGERTIGEDKVPLGTQLKVRIAPLSDKKVRLTGMLEVSSIRSVTEEGVVPRESFSVHFDKTIDIGNQARICVSKSYDKERWFELLVQEPKDLRTDQTAVHDSAATEPLAARPATSRRLTTTEK